MSVNLRKGQRLDLTKEIELKNIIIGLGWDTNKYEGRYDFDLDASVFLVGENEKVHTEEDFVFYGNLIHKSGAIEHMGDNRTGDGDGDDEVIKVKLKDVPKNIQKLIFTVTIYDSELRKQNFGQISNAYIRIYDEENEKELLRYDLGEDFSIETAVVVGEIYRNNGGWKFNAVGAGFKNGLAGLCRNYGIDVA